MTPPDLFEQNLRLNELEISERRTVLCSWPRELMVILTSRCNLECIMCTREVSNKVLPEDIAFKTTELFPYLETVNWQGGEAFTVPYFQKLVEAAGSFPRIHQWITTSGVLITRAWAETLSRAGVFLGLSIDGVTRGTYERIRRGARFERLLESLEYLREASARFPGRGHKELCATIMRSNYRELELFVEFAREHRFRSIVLGPVLYLTDEENIFHSRDEEALSFLEAVRPRVERKAREYGLALNWRLPGSANDDRRRPASGHDGLRCKKPWKKLHVNAISEGGNAYPECFCPGGSYVGNLGKQSIAEIWNSPVMQEYRRRIVENRMSGFCSEVCVSGDVDPSILAE